MGLAIAFWISAVVAVAGALGVILQRNVFRAALSLVGCFVAVAALYVTLSADFLAAAQILVYVGAISVLIILAVMMTRDVQQGNPFNRMAVPVLIVVVIFLGVVIYAVTATPWQISATPPLEPTTPAIAASLFGEKGFVLPVVTGALLLLSAIIGAVVLARENKE
ncbi:NADH-quinone oxidoreductase subunit J [Chloroflexota bacterium]